MSDPILKVTDLYAGYDGIPVVFGISLEVMPGELVAIVGANGAGKTTTMRTISGLNHPLKGQIFFEGIDISRLAAHQTLQLGISYVPEGRRIFAKLSVEKNLSLGAYTENSQPDVHRRMEELMELFPVLRTRSKQVAETLSGGEQQMLAIARALMSGPRMVLMDEVSLGLMPIYVEETFKVIQNLHRQGVTILLVEQNARKALAAANRGYVLETGEIVLSDQADKLAMNPQVKKAYLGGAGGMR